MESNFSTRVISEMLALSLQSEDISRTGRHIKGLLDQISTEAPFPLIITDTEGRPLFWKVHGIEFARSYGKEDFEHLQKLDLDDPQDPGLVEIIAMARDFRAEHQAVVFYYPGAESKVQGYVCFGQSDLARSLGSAIIVQLVMLLIFFGVGVLGFFLMKRFEQESIWVGLSKETAHQMGTPLTSLLGWLQLGQSRLETMDEAGELPPVTLKSFREAFDEMGWDVDRLQKVSARFNNIGGSPAKKRAELRPVVERTVRYFRRRLPHHRVQVEIREQYDEVPLVLFHDELIEWVVENLIKNALDAIDKEQGVISISLSYNATERTVDLHVRDNGRGMTPAQRRKIFRPGFTTKTRGWGLGLTLSRRIIEEYHDAHLILLDSHEGHGSCFLIRFPV